MGEGREFYGERIKSNFMENASKALLIAGAILIVILLISLGIYIYSQAQQQIDAVNMDEQQVLAFNNKFAPYLGNNITGSQVNALLQQIQASNSQAGNMGYEEITFTEGSNITSTTGRAATGKTYTVTPAYSENTGLLKEVKITVNTTTGDDDETS